MNVIVFGATGSVGKLAVESILSEGHKVTAFARNPGALSLDHPKLTRHAGDARNAEAVLAALRGHDAAVIAIGSGKARKSAIRSVATLNVIQAMQALGIRRLVCQSTLGAHESWDNLNFFWKRIMFGLLLRPVFLDHERQESLVRASGLDWTIVRPSAFADGPASGRFREGFDASARGLSLTISRADVAAFLKRQITETTYLRRAVAISN